MRGKERFAQGITEIGRRVKNTKSAVVGELRNIGGTLAGKTTKLRSSLRKVTRQSLRRSK